MGFWLLRSIVGVLAVAATLVPASATAFHGYEIFEADQEEERLRSDAQLELVLFQTEIAIEAALISSKSDDVKPFLTVALEEARTRWLEARDHWRAGDYYEMGIAIENGHHHLARDGIIVAPDPNGGKSDSVARPDYPWDIAIGGGLAALLLWSIWSGMTRAPRPSVPVPVFPGEVEIARKEAEEAEKAPNSAIPDLAPKTETKRPASRTRIKGTATPKPKGLANGASVAASQTSAATPEATPPATPEPAADAPPGHLTPNEIEAQAEGSDAKKPKKETSSLAPSDD